MKRMWRALGLVAAGMLSAPVAPAAIIGTGLFGNTPRIIGVVKPGEVDEVAQSFADGLKHPLTLMIYPASDPVEVAKIGLWLQERRPPLQVKDDCVGSCARSILLSSGTVTIKPGSVVAFGGMAEAGAHMKAQIDAGTLFIEDERSQAARERFLQTFKPWIDRGLAVRTQYARLAPMPAAARSFIEALTGEWRIERLDFGTKEFKFEFRPGRHACLWWVPDAASLKQLGLYVPGYRPVSRSDAARALKVPDYLIYVGPVLDALPEQPLCAEPANAPTFNVPELP